MTDTIDLAEKFHKTVYANGEMDVCGRLVHLQTVVPHEGVMVTRMPLKHMPEMAMALTRDQATELRDVLAVWLAATGG